MSGKPYDAAVRTLIGTRPEDWLRFLNLPDDSPVTVLDTDVSFVSSAADGLLRVEYDKPYGLHFEFESGHHGNELPGRLCAYNLWASQKYKVAFWSVLVLLKPESDSPRITGSWEQRLPDAAETLVYSFRYQTVRVWQIAPEEFLGTGFGVFPLAPIGAIDDAGLPALIERMTGIVDQAVTENRLSDDAANDLWAATYVLFGARHDRAFAKLMLGKVHRMRESSTFQAILEEGREEGREEGIRRGIEQGSIETLRKTLLYFGAKRFGQPSPQVRSRLEAVRVLVELEVLQNRLDAVETWDELLHEPAL